MISGSSSIRVLAKVFGIVLLAAVLLLLLKPLMVGQGKDKAKPATASNTPQPRSATASDLARRLDQILDDAEKSGSRWGVFVLSLSDGAIVYERNGSKLFTPASNMKIYTTSVALELLGPEYHWRTSVYAKSAPDANGRINGDLVLYGRGAPDLVATSKDAERGSLQKLADDLYARGVRTVSGNIIGDESYFRGDPLGDGWQWTDLQWYFGAEASALTVNENQIDVNFVPSTNAKEPSTVRTSDTEGYVKVENRMVPSRENRSTIGVHRGLSDNNVAIWGEYPPGSKGFGARLSVHQPALWAAMLFGKILKQRGIKVEGQMISRDSRVAPTERFDPTKATELAFVNSQPLRDIIRRTNKESNNLYAELLLRTIGRERGEMVPAPEKSGRERGDEEAGLAVVRLWLSRSGIGTNQLALHDGSGLSRLDLVTPEASARLLATLARSANASVFRDSLPIAGRDGTLGGRLKAVENRVYAKTGSLTYDNSLAGYLTTEDGRTFAFSIMSNDQTTRREATSVIDQVVILTASLPRLPSETGQIR
jgi:D-alanyl-D-alanine carboxypeptidase/D-alanyl-D-alanine-endopeptidase (penicillin-binding protein 4)